MQQLYKQIYNNNYTTNLFWNFGARVVLLLWRQSEVKTSFKTLVSKGATILGFEKPLEQI